MTIINRILTGFRSVRRNLQKKLNYEGYLQAPSAARQFTPDEEVVLHDIGHRAPLPDDRLYDRVVRPRSILVKLFDLFPALTFLCEWRDEDDEGAEPRTTRCLPVSSPALSNAQEQVVAEGFAGDGSGYREKHAHSKYCEILQRIEEASIDRCH